MVKKILKDLDKGMKEATHCSCRILTKKRKIRWIEIFSRNVIYANKEAVLSTIIDITEKKEAEQELINLNKLKSEILTRTSHELKTPLVSIKGFSQLLLEFHRDELNNDVISKIKEIRKGCNRLENLISDIIKTSQLESAKIEFKPSIENLAFLIKTTVKKLEAFADLRNHTVNLNIHDELKTLLDREKIYDVINNILINAINYTPPDGKIEIKSEIKNNDYIVSIKDNGIGFTKEEKKRIFKRFGKIEHYGQGFDLRIEGSGLGLYISKKIIELHGGKIWIESEGRHKGSTFYFSLPIIKNLKPQTEYIISQIL